MARERRTYRPKHCPSQFHKDGELEDRIRDQLVNIHLEVQLRIELKQIEGKVDDQSPHYVVGEDGRLGEEPSSNANDDYAGLGEKPTEPKNLVETQRHTPAHNDWRAGLSVTANLLSHCDCSVSWWDGYREN